MFQVTKKGTFQVIEGNLGSAPTITEIKGQKVVKLSIAERGASKKNAQGEWEEVTIWRNFTFWSGNGAVDELIAHIESTKDKDTFPTFKSGNTVQLYVVSTSELVESKKEPGKFYINEKDSEYLRIYKVLSGRSNNTNTGEGAESPKQETKVETLASVVDEIPIPADWQ